MDLADDTGHRRLDLVLYGRSQHPFAFDAHVHMEESGQDRGGPGENDEGTQQDPQERPRQDETRILEQISAFMLIECAQRTLTVS